ncbi:hypothetical protein Sgleb_37370 [Streptomyces glebosus]|uniref:ABC3 transporter permease C-terminal domain-containing protein n=2 Tax=Streptomyces glebosus TaxID=249580 RepID=A0A640SXI8_9ACTN|nr:hypothetical protein Sgleb_37370 [Streptomyces glebosus]GHG52062.1 hypothetical protein GCM10010513_12060 [Streptomyces glebosus]
MARLAAVFAGAGAAAGAVAAALAAAVPGARVETSPAPVRVAAEAQALTEVVTMAAVSVIGGFTVIAVLSTLSLIAFGRRPELRLLRLAGAGRRTLRLEAAAMALTGLAVGAAVATVPLLAFSLGVARTVPYLPPVPAVVLVAVVAATTGAGTLLPARAVLRGRYPGSGATGG